MDIQKLLEGRDCGCGMHHTCEIAHVIIKPGAIGEIADLVETYEHILLTADEHTYEVCGKELEAQLHGKLEGRLIYQREGLLVPNEEAVAEMEEKLTKNTDLILGIGSGVIQDLCKYVSFQAKLPYFICATAPSMDGYASKGAAMIMGNMKVTYNAHVPKAIIGDVDILKNAPMDMIRSGYGDILGKYSCLNDWRLSQVVLEEYFCEYVYELTYEMLIKTRDLGEALQKREPEAIQTLMETLVGVGIAMAYVGNSRPASGSEHHLSHFFEVTGILENRPYFMHGTDVAYSAVYTQRLREALLSIEKPRKGRSFDRTAWEGEIRRVYGKAAEGVIALQNRLGWHERELGSVYEERWTQIQNVLREAPSSEQLTGYLKSVGLDLAEFEQLYGKEKIQDALCYAKDLKDRYTVLWMYDELTGGKEA